jgi:hypothetical protein
VGKARGVDMSKLATEEDEGLYGRVAETFGISRALAAEIMFMNDEFYYGSEAPEARFSRMKKWIEESLLPV